MYYAMAENLFYFKFLRVFLLYRRWSVWWLFMICFEQGAVEGVCMLYMVVFWYGTGFARYGISCI